MYRIGMGYDVHQLVEGRPCIIGGVEFDYEKGLKGHSDADVLLHAICDALLGSVALGDLGTFFPDNDPQYKNADSKVLLKNCYEKVREKGYEVSNLDTVVICEAPKINPRKNEIQKMVADILECDETQVSIKATTEEKLGFTGSGQGIKAWAYVMVKEI